MADFDFKRSRFVREIAELCVRLNLAGVIAMAIDDDGAIHRCQCSPSADVKAELDELAAAQREWLEARGTFAGQPLGDYQPGGTCEMDIYLNRREN